MNKKAKVENISNNESTINEEKIDNQAINKDSQIATIALSKSENNKQNFSSNDNKKEAVKKTVKTMTIEILTILLGTFILALGFKIFLNPHNIVPGGFMGVAKIIYDVLYSSTGFKAIDISVWYIILNVFLYIYAVKCLGWKYGIRAGVGIASYSLFVFIIDQTNLIDMITTQFEAETATSYILYAIYGGVLMGTGIGFVFRGNGSTGGSDVLAVVVNKFFPTITTGQIIIVIDGLVVVLSALVYGSLVLPLYALITIFISGKVSDMFVDGVRSLRAYYVVTDKKEELSQEIFNKLNRGVTNLKCEGMFSHNDRDMLLIIVRRSQIIKLKKIVKRIDPNSFMFAHNVKEAYGNGFIAYAKEKTKKNKKDNMNIEANLINQNSQNNIVVNKNETIEIKNATENEQAEIVVGSTSKETAKNKETKPKTKNSKTKSTSTKSSAKLNTKKSTK